MVNASARRSWTRAQLEVAQDAFVAALRRLRAVEDQHRQLHTPLDLEHAHELLSIRSTFLRAREELRMAEAEAEAAREAA